MTTTPATESPAASRGRRKVRRRLRRAVSVVLLACFALAVLAASLVLTAPATSLARLVQLPPQIAGLQGRLWQGRAVLVNDMMLDWSLRGADLLRGRLGFDLELTGPRTLLAGVAGSGFAGTGLSKLDGRLGPEILALIPGPDAPVCDSGAVIRDVSLLRGRGTVAAGGSIAIAEGRCTRTGATPMEVPALAIDLSRSEGGALARATRRDAPDDTLAEGRLTVDRLILRLEPAGARLVPGLPSSAATVIEYPL